MHVTQKFFITGTDTEVGKTYITCCLLNYFNKQNYSTLAIKPVASGCDDNELTDTDLLIKNSTIKLARQHITPFAFKPAIAPHIAATLVNEKMTTHLLNEKCQFALQQPADIMLVEGFGGWCAPINLEETMADFVVQQRLRVILVVGMRLGCLNHSVLTLRAMQLDKVEIAGWIANCLDPGMVYLQENMKSLEELLTIPCLGVVKHNSTAKEFKVS